MKLKKECLIIIKDEVNIEIKNLDAPTRRKLNEKFKFFIPGARFSTAYKYGRWDGKISYFGLNGDTYYNLLEDILPVLEDSGYVINDKTFRDERIPFDFDIKEVTETYLYDNFNAVWPEDHMLAGEPILLRDYQVEAINKFIKNPQSIEELCTSFGKTILTAVLSHITEPYGKSLVIVPNKDLVKQTYKDYENLGLDVGMYYGDVKEIGHKHTITTWQSIEVLKKNKKQGKISEEGIAFDDISEGVITLIIDECFSPETPVLTNKGYVEIQHIKEGDKVINYNEETKIFKEDTVVNIKKNIPTSKSEKMLEITLENNVTIKVTANHKFLTENRGWVRADQLTTEDEIIEYKRNNV